MPAMTTPTRRQVLAGSAAYGASALGWSSAVAADGQQAGKLTVVVAGGHPDDPESGAGGTMARLADLGHDVFAVYLTRGEAGIPGKSHAEAARIRTAEAEAACAILRAKAVFAGQVDGATEVTAARYDAFAQVLLGLKPDAVFTHWPVDTHRDHRAASLLTYDAWLKAGRSFALFYFEVMTGTQTQAFRPTHYVDITTTEQRKRDACFAHKSQNPQGFYEAHDLMNRFRGREGGCKYAEAFVHHDQSRPLALP
jgi:N-acetylglucosamine malate deacetylase 1